MATRNSKKTLSKRTKSNAKRKKAATGKKAAVKRKAAAPSKKKTTKRKTAAAKKKKITKRKAAASRKKKTTRRKTAAAKKKRTTKRKASTSKKKRTAKRKASSTRKKKVTKRKKATGKKKSVGARVRMYRVGFGDFFLLTVPGKNGPAHILIDCGVHAANIKSMDECVKNLIEETNSKLALVILTHYHADHMSGFASNFDEFANFEVGAVWITNRLDPGHATNAKFMAQLTSLAGELKLQLGARSDEAGRQAAAKVENALGYEFGVVKKKREGSNAKALRLLQTGFKNAPPVYYYQGGDTPTLPDELEGLITADILAPSPKDSGGEFASSDNKTEQYLAAVSDRGLSNLDQISPFEKAWPATAKNLSENAFDEFVSDFSQSAHSRLKEGAARMEAALQNMQPDVLAAAADKVDGTLNNQSLVVLFTVSKKKLLFVGDAQWGNWSYWLYGKNIKGADPGILPDARAILESIDFYKVGHHGSTNATPIPVVGALSENCASMCSTATGAYGNPKKHSEVPRTSLMTALEKRTGNRLVRSDWVAAADAEPDADARAATPELPPGFRSPGQLYIDYDL